MTVVAPKAMHAARAAVFLFWPGTVTQREKGVSACHKSDGERLQTRASGHPFRFCWVAAQPAAQPASFCGHPARPSQVSHLRMPFATAGLCTEIHVAASAYRACWSAVTSRASFMRRAQSGSGSFWSLCRAGLCVVLVGGGHRWGVVRGLVDPL